MRVIAALREFAESASTGEQLVVDRYCDEILSISLRYPSAATAEFDAYLATKLLGVPPAERCALLARLRACDLAIAFAAAGGHSAAVAEVNALVANNCARWIRVTGADAHDTGQRALSYLLVREAGAPARILEYRGVAPLASLLRIVCTRTAISMARKVLAESNLSLSFEVVAPGADPELLALKQRFAAPFAEALKRAIKELSPRNKTLLKMHYTRGVPVAELATTYNVHRVSMSRWLAEAKQSVFEATRTALRASIDVSESEFESIVHLLRSDLDVRLSTLRDDELP
jgi:RNA polymerase sigma-70 factor, ECF subfamily